jgi:ectoine hydroxylase-related dioxygenase (phytanoyl-CoA dioxygenase family)
MDTMKTIGAEERERLRQDGFLILRGFFDPAETETIRAWTDEVAAWPDAPGKYQRYYETALDGSGRRILNRLEDFARFHRGFDALFRAGRLHAAVSTLLGEPAVLFKDKINFKLPGGDGFKAHQDQQAGWGAYASLFLSALVGIDAASVENGCLEIVSGRNQALFKEWEPLGDADMQDMTFVPCLTEPGDVIVFDSFTPHRSGPNRTDRPRRLMYVTYNRLSEGDQRARYFADKRKNYPQDCEREPGREYRFKV